MTELSTLGMGTHGATWQAAGYAGAGSVSQYIGSLQGRPALVAGGARGVFEEVLEVREHYGMELAIFAANDVGMYLDRLDHWCSLHADNLDGWKHARWLHNRGPEDVVIHSIDQKPSVHVVWKELRPVFALSGYFAMQLAWIMGANPIILCGCPGGPMPRFFEAKPRSTFGYGGLASGADKGARQQVIDEMRRIPEFKVAVRSMSGWTQEFFGAPTW